MADIEAMFYQVFVPEEQRSYLRFLWWPDSNINQELEEYEMCVHLFDAISSPSCANIALKKTSDDSQDSFGKEAAATVKRDFYVDDLLKSQKTEESATDLVKNASLRRQKNQLLTLLRMQEKCVPQEVLS